MVNKNDFFTIDIDKHALEINEFDDGVISYINTKLDRFQCARQEKEETWLESWAMYFGNSAANRHLVSQTLKSVGNVEGNWRHNLNTGKAFEQVETVVAYFQQAFFPNRDWFDVIPTEPGYPELARLVKEFTRKKLAEANFISHWEIFLRQLAITGVSVMALPWRVESTKYKKKVKVRQPVYNDEDFALSYGGKVQFEVKEESRLLYNAPAFETLDIFDFYIDPYATNLRYSECIRRIILTRAELAESVKAGFYKLDMEEITNAKTYYAANTFSDSMKQRRDVFQGITVQDKFSWQDQIELLEYWGDIIVNGTVYRDVVATICGKNLLRFENNPYWCGKPFIIGAYTPTVRNTSALGVVEPSLGLLHEMNIVTNQRLDNLEISVDSMFEVINDGTLNAEDIRTKPGEVYFVTQPNTIRPIELPKAFVISYDEANVLEQRIDKNAGTGNYISANASRDAERVTAEEIRAAREAGGNRLSAVHKRIEETALMPLLEKVFRLFQQFVEDDEIVRIPGQNPDDFDYVAVGAEELSYDYKLMPVGADHVADKEYDLSQRLNFLNLASQNPQMAQYVNYYNFMVDLARRMGIDDIDQFIQQQSPDGMGMQQPSLSQDLQEAGGQPLANAVNAQMSADGGMQMMQDLFGADMSQVPVAQMPPM